MFNFFCWGQFFAQKALNFRGTNLSLLLIFKFLSATEIDKICRGVCHHLYIRSKMTIIECSCTLGVHWKNFKLPSHFSPDWDLRVRTLLQLRQILGWSPSEGNLSFELMLLVHSNHRGTTVSVYRSLQHWVEQILRVQNNFLKEIGKNLTLISAHNYCWEAPIHLIRFHYLTLTSIEVSMFKNWDSDC
jgi:hypothetical protein